MCDDEFNCNTKLIIKGTYDQIKQILFSEFNSILKKNFKVIFVRKKAMKLEIKSIYNLNHSLSPIKLYEIFNKYENIEIISDWFCSDIGCQGIFIGSNNNILEKQWYTGDRFTWRDIMSEVCDLPQIVLADNKDNTEEFVIEAPPIPSKITN